MTQVIRTTEPLPRWIMERYSKLWVNFRNSDFTFDDAKKILSRDNVISLTLSQLRKSGWLEAKLSAEDARKRVYRLKSPEEAVARISGLKAQLNAGKRRRS